MKGNLVIVESPTKARKIQSYLGSDYMVKSSEGHIRDLEDKNISIDIAGGFVPQYVIPSRKTKLVEDLKKSAKAANAVWLASDEDREGEAIAWHLCEVLGLDKNKTRRIVFHEVTKPAIEEAIKNPRKIDLNLVDAQQARRVLDRLVGFELSPVLWKKVQPKLSAGRVQSVALRLIVDREREILAFGSEKYYKVDGVFTPSSGKAVLKATLNTRFTAEEQATDFLSRSVGASYSVGNISSREGVRTPSYPFTTSSLQQEAARKLGMSVNQTMQIAQKLYEEGLITYMRTDSVNLSSLAIGAAKKFICDNFGEEYSHPRNYRTKTKGAQEAHEAIRPTYIANAEIQGTPAEKKLYSLIWKRTVASQMSDAKVLNTSIDIVSDKVSEIFKVETTKVLFDGFIRVYSDEDEKTTDNVFSCDIRTGMELKNKSIVAACKFTSAPPRYNQGTLVKKLEEMQIGRPSTYASIISTLIKGRGYVVEGDREGREETVTDLVLENGKITAVQKKETVGAEKRKLLPQDIGIMVTDYLVEHFPEVMDYGFTAKVEEDFDEIADGNKQWKSVISDFYGPFHDEVSSTISDSGYHHVEREIGIDPSDGKKVVAKYGQYGPYVQKGEGQDKICASLSKGQIIESLTLEEALILFQLPRTLGRNADNDVIVTKGRFGAYIKCGGKNYSLPKDKDPFSITLQQALEIISEQDNRPAVKVIAQWGELQILEGKYGPYIKSGNSNFKIPSGTNAFNLKEEDVRRIVNSSAPTSKKHRYFKKK